MDHKKIAERAVNLLKDWMKSSTLVTTELTKRTIALLDEVKPSRATATEIMDSKIYVGATPPHGCCVATRAPAGKEERICSSIVELVRERAEWEKLAEQGVPQNDALKYFRALPSTPVRAIQIRAETLDNLHAIMVDSFLSSDLIAGGTPSQVYLEIRTPHGSLRASFGDWLILDHGVWSVCSGKDFPYRYLPLTAEDFAPGSFEEK